MSCEVKSCMFVTNISIHNIKSSNYNIAFSSEEVILSDLGEKYAQIKHRLQVKTVQNCSKQKCWWILM